MWSGTCLTSKLYDKIVKTPSKCHETIPLRPCPGRRKVDSTEVQGNCKTAPQKWCPFPAGPPENRHRKMHENSLFDQQYV
jgi:hypothetical protein